MTKKKKTTTATTADSLRDQIDVTLLEEHEDGSATYQFKMSPEAQARIFSAFLIDGLIRGITEVEIDNAVFAERKRRFGDGELMADEPENKASSDNH